MPLSPAAGGHISAAYFKMKGTKMLKFLKDILIAILATARNWRLMLLFILLLQVAGGLHAASSSLLDAIETVESSGNIKAIGDGGKAVGCLQIHKAVIDDVNRIYGKTYQLKDRYSRSKSREIASLYLSYWGNHYEKKTGKKATNDVLARIWNGGCYGWKKQATIKYWNKVKKAMK